MSKELKKNKDKKKKPESKKKKNLRNKVKRWAQNERKYSLLYEKECLDNDSK